MYPLKPTSKSWAVNKNTGMPKITRKGFVMVPDYASTAFMIQGATLEAMIADCGDLWKDACSLSRRNNAYVILSRVKQASGILLLRAFPAKVFQQGEPPGPRCLFKLLRSRFDEDSGQLLQKPNAEYGPADAEKEYLELDEKWKRANKKSHERSWPCGLCGVCLLYTSPSPRDRG